MPLLQFGEHLAAGAAECGENHLCILDERQLQHFPDLQQALTFIKSSTLEIETSNFPVSLLESGGGSDASCDCQKFLQKQLKKGQFVTSWHSKHSRHIVAALLFAFSAHNSQVES